MKKNASKICIIIYSILLYSKIRKSSCQKSKRNRKKDLKFVFIKGYSVCIWESEIRSSFSLASFFVLNNLLLKFFFSKWWWCCWWGGEEKNSFIYIFFGLFYHSLVLMCGVVWDEAILNVKNAWGRKVKFNALQINIIRISNRWLNLYEMVASSTVYIDWGYINLWFSSATENFIRRN